MDTYFASVQRASEDQLKIEINSVIKNQVVQELLHSISGLIAVLDENRQVVAINDSFLQMIGIENPGEILGLRLGEVLKCIHSFDEPAGCGTTKFCSTCGAAVAIVSTLALDRPVEKICALTAHKNNIQTDMSLLVRGQPLKIDGMKFILIFLQDISLEQLRAGLERTFFHDISNMLTGLLGASQMLANKNQDSRLAEIVRQSALRLANEITIQKCLFSSDTGDYQVVRQDFTTTQFLNEIDNFFHSHTVSLNKNLILQQTSSPLSVRTDISLSLRVMCNMVTNALEATEENGTVKVWFEQENHSLVFNVWNQGSIPEEVKQRVFQRNYSTKEGSGRGFGTYSMQLLGEKILGGKVSFFSSETEGTTFKYAFNRSA